MVKMTTQGVSSVKEGGTDSTVHLAMMVSAVTLVKEEVNLCKDEV